MRGVRAASGHPPSLAQIALEALYEGSHEVKRIVDLEPHRRLILGAG